MKSWSIEMVDHVNNSSDKLRDLIFWMHSNERILWGGNVSMVFSKSRVEDEWFGKSHTHISSSQYSLIDKKLLQVSSRSQISGLDLSVGSEIKKELKNTSGQTYVKDDFANLDDFETKPITSPKMRVHSTYLLHCLSFVLTWFFVPFF